MIPSARILNSEDCPKRQCLMQTLEREALSPHQLLYRGVNHGVQSESDDPGKAASDEVMRLCWSRPIETEQSDLIGMAEHVSALAEIIVWCLRPNGPWVHPSPLPNWHPGSWAVAGGLRRIVLCDRWSERRALQEVRSWQTLEGAIYGLPMTILAVSTGAMREGRMHGPLTKGWTHPRSRELRFKKRDGSGFDGNWDPIWREQYDGTREEWLDAMTADGVMEDVIQIVPAVQWDADEILHVRDIAEKKLASLVQANATRSLSKCFDSVRPCEFRFPCAFFKEPQSGQGFVTISECAAEGSEPSNVQIVPQMRP